MSTKSFAHVLPVAKSKLNASVPTHISHLRYPAWTCLNCRHRNAFSIVGKCLRLIELDTKQGMNHTVFQTKSDLG